MPCFTVTTVKADIGKLNLERVKTVLQSGSFNARIINGQLEVYGRTVEAAETTKKQILQAYSAQTIKDASKRFGFRINTQSKLSNGNIQLHLSR
ncbi:MAG: hypothetical protein PHN44_00185 [Candidatus Marinimicrobia bacterium]|nr:hypothetical protein [Candidatus Neomarinimicrobiota bacterium]